MKRLTRIRLINWHLFEDTTINCHGTTYFIGINGAGKSTILDAIQFALVGGQRDVRFNQAALSGGKRTLASYVRGELGTEGRRYLRGDATGVIALEFRNPDDSCFVHGAVIDAFEDGRTPEVVYFIIHNSGLNDAWFFKEPGRLYDTRSFKRNLEQFALPPGGRAQTFTRLEDYRLHLLNRLGQLKDSFPGKIVKGLAFSPLIDMRSFVHNYLLDENLVDVKALQAQLETLRHFENLAANVRERIGALDQIEELDKERSANRRRRITNGFITRRAQADTHLAELKSLRVQLAETQLNLSRAELQREELNLRLRHAQAGLVDAQVAIQTDHTARREQELRENIAAVEKELADLHRRRAEIASALDREANDARRLHQLLVSDGQAGPAWLEDFLAAADEALSSGLHNARDDETPEDGLGPAISKLQTGLEELGHKYTSLNALADEQARQLRQEAEQLEREILQLRTGDQEASYEAEAPQAVRLRGLLRAVLGLEADEVVFLCSTLDIPDPAWQDAVEGVLGRSRFSLLVPPVHYATAMQLYRERRQKDGLHSVGLVDAERILAQAQHLRPTRPDSLAGEVQSGHPAARAFVDLLLGGYVKCDTLEALRQHRTAVTRECFVRRNFTDSHLNPQVYRRWFIGERAAHRQIEQRQARLEEIAAELVSLNQQLNAVRERLSLTRDKARPIMALEHALPELERIPPLESQSASMQAELASLDVSNLAALRAEAERRQAERDRLQAEVAALERYIGGLESRAETLDQETIPNLEREVDQILQGAEQFLRAEYAGEADLTPLNAEIEKEYERRRERQPLEVVLQNATRYENDYQGAESRSRDRLREAKQAYSLRYDFGYDDQEDGARYLAERQKLSESELPHYEGRIAEQRSLAEQELVENFIHRLREQIEEARQQLAYLNTTLAQLRFGGERYEFLAQPAASLRQIYDMVMDSQNILGDSLFESSFRQKHQQGWDLLFERLNAGIQQAGRDEDLELDLRELQDYRNYLQYDIRIHYPNGDRALLSQINAKKSGGETTTPFYVAMAASFAQAYRLNQPRPADTIRLALFDEAFSKMDTARTGSALQFMRETGLQVLLATPPDKSGSLLPYIDTVCTVVRKNNHAFVVEIDKAEVLAELETTQ